MLAVVAGILALAPTAALAQQDQAQAATQVTVDLTALDRSDHREALAQTGPQNEGGSDPVRIQWRTSARFVPNSGSIRIRATTAKPGTVERMIHRKKCG